MDEEQSSSIRMKLPPLNPELRDSIRTRLRPCLTCEPFKGPTAKRGDRVMSYALDHSHCEVTRATKA